MGRSDFIRDGLRLSFEDVGEGLPVIWQHGLGADAAQPAEVFPADVARRITLECRGHGGSETGSETALSIQTFAADVLALADHLKLDRFVVGGISLGAAIALRIAADRPDRVAGLVLARPAWLTDAAPATLAPYTEVARLLESLGPVAGAEAFVHSPTYAMVREASPDNAQSLRWFFDRPRGDSTVPLLRRIPLDGPGVNEAAIRAINAPTLVIGNARDHVHPLATAEALAGLIPGARFVRITGKSDDRTAYLAEFRAALAEYLAGIEGTG